MHQSQFINCKALLIWNPAAGRRNGRRRHEVEAAQKILKEEGIEVELCQTNQLGEGAERAREAVREKVGLIVVCGGDGTINDVLQGMVGSHIPLAILPGGTANVLARELRLPLDIGAATRLMVKSTPRRIAVGKLQDRHFLLMAGIGFDAAVIRNIHPQWKKRLGMATYILQALHHLIKEPLQSFTVADGDQKHRATFVCVSRAKYYGPMKLIPEASLLSDLFYVYCFSSTNPFRYLYYTAALLTNLQGRLPDFKGFAANSVECKPISSNEPGAYLQVDGEFAGELPCSIRVVPDALTLMLPPTMNAYK